jgi:hypothetical protein
MQRIIAVTPPATPATDDFPDFLAVGSVAPADSFGDEDIRPEDGVWDGGLASEGTPPRMTLVVIVVKGNELLRWRVDVEVTNVAGADAQKLAETVDGVDEEKDEVTGLGATLVGCEDELASTLVSEALSIVDASVADG